MVFGGISHERLQINEDTVYAGGPYDPANSQALSALPRVRELISAGRYSEAEALVNERMMGTPLRQMPYQPLADLVMDFRGIGDVRGYRRDLSLDAAVTTSGFAVGDTSHVREAFVSAVDQCVVVRLRTLGAKKLALRVWLDSEQDVEVTPDGDGLLLHGRNRGHQGVAPQLTMALRLQVLLPAGGQMHVSGSALEVRNAEEVLLLLTAGTNYRRYDDLSGDPLAITSMQMNAAVARSYADLLERHQQEHRRLFRRVHINLGPTASAHLPTDERVRDFIHRDDPALAALYHQFGRYLLICSSRQGSQPANLQGIWNDLMSPPWDSKYTININTQMNYWPAHSSNLSECSEPLHAMIADLAVSGSRTAQRMYNARGWVAHHNTDLWRATAPIDGARTGMWPSGGAWLCQHLWDHWEYHRDRTFLAQAYPLMKGAAEFFVDTLIEDPRTGEWVTSPSQSPEQEHPFGSTLCAGPAMDSQLLRDLFDHCAAAADILGRDRQFATELRALREKLPPDRIGASGQLQEWREDWDMQAPDRHHRHVSHLYGLYPSDQINPRDTPALAAAARRTLEIRGDDATGWGLGWRLNLWARLGDGEHAYKVLEMLLSPDRTYPNLFDAHPPFQIDGNFGGTAGITEMLVQSWGGSVFLLPALPTAWPTGEVRGLRVHGAATLNMAWRQGVLVWAEIQSERGGHYEVSYAGQTQVIKLGSGASRRVGIKEGRFVSVVANDRV
jgi:alpha-L-fucosidase 2